ncbi:MAG TPA: cytochrome c oxidase subunit 3 [Pyrinomonadaceae bacterium]|jgi:heme/copper-type cytochrome/quinol oxidase subunit 3
MTNEELIGRKTLHVEELPSTLLDYHEPIWWGNLLLLFIETTMFGILVAIYFSVWMNLSPFPPPRVDRLPVLYDSAPELLLPTVGLIVLLASMIPAIWLDLSARRKDEKMVKILLPITLLINIAAIVIRFQEFDSLLFKWDDNAYGSITWVILGTHLMHLIILCAEDFYLLAWTYKEGLDDKHALDLTVMAVYWYWIVGIWVLLYMLVYLAPRFL